MIRRLVSLHVLAITRPSWAQTEIGNRIFCLLIGFDVLANAVITLFVGGEAYTTISCRVGMSIKSGGWASRVPWPQWWINHCEESVFETVV